MENRLKERLTGAAILVALVVLLVPEMFRGQRSDVAATASSGEGPPVRSYTIDLSNGPARTAPLQSTPAVAAVAAAGDSSAEAAATTAPTPTPPAPTAVSSAPASAPARTAAPNNIVATVSKPHAGAAAAWSVQLGLFAQHDNAERLMHSAQSKGFAASISERDAKGLYHVEVGNLSDRAAAQAMQERLRDQGLPAAVVSPPPAMVKGR